MSGLLNQTGTKRAFRGSGFPYNLQKRRLIEAFNNFKIETTITPEDPPQDEAMKEPPLVQQEAPPPQKLQLVLDSFKLELPSVLLKQDMDLAAGRPVPQLVFTEPALRRELLKSSLRHCLTLAKTQAAELGHFL